MTDTVQPPQTAIPRSALRTYGTWAESPYMFGELPEGPPGARKRFTWTQAVTTRQGRVPLVLNYFADAHADSKRMNELTYLAAIERQALEVLETMILAALNGTGYLALPHPVVEVQKDVCQVVREWITRGTSPDTWETELQQVIASAFQRLSIWKQQLQTMQARVDPAHEAWGLAVALDPIRPTTAAP